MEIFVVFRHGVYRHECGGLFSSLEKAEEIAQELLKNEPDNWHHYRVYRFSLDEKVDNDYPGRWDACWTERQPISKFHRDSEGLIVKNGNAWSKV